MKTLRERMNEKLTARGVDPEKLFAPDAPIFGSLCEAVEEQIAETFKEFEERLDHRAQMAKQRG